MRAKIKPPPDKIAANKRNRRKLLPTAILRLMIRRRGARKRRPKVLQPKKNANIKAHGLTEYSGENPPGRLNQPCRQGSKSPLPVRALSLWPVGQAAKTPPFHGGNMGSIPVRVTSSKMQGFQSPFSPASRNPSHSVLLTAVRTISFCCPVRINICTGRLHGPLVKWSRRRPLTPQTGVRLSHGSPQGIAENRHCGRHARL